MNVDVFVARCPATYDVASDKGVSVAFQAMQGIWTAMGLSPESPFQKWLAPGGCVVIKPNWVMDINLSGGSMDCLVTNSTLIEPLIRWCAEGMLGQGRVIVGDCPIQGCDFHALMRHTRMDEAVQAIRRDYPKLTLEIADWRLTVLRRAGGSCCHPVYADQTLRDSQVEVSEQYSVLDTGRESFLEEISDYADRFRVTMYKPSLLQSHHRPGVHQYLVRNEVLDADLLINLGKMKTHEKAGLTGAMKNLVGVNGHKEFLPHHIKGSYSSGGDSYCLDNWFAARAEEVYDDLWERCGEISGWRRWYVNKIYMALRAAARLSGGDRIAPGGWSGNDTVWRMILDLNHLLFFGAKRSRHILNVVDGIVAGEGEGPLRPTAKPVGMVLVGENPAYVDAVIAKLMGYNLVRVPTVYHAVYNRKSKFGGPGVEEMPMHFIDPSGAVHRGSWKEVPNLSFKPPRHWQRAMYVQ
ncbi:MAG: DUF362 domain-containing protein [Thermoguttaceae bacterium]